jgi:hypothetical protein
MHVPRPQQRGNEFERWALASSHPQGCFFIRDRTYYFSTQGTWREGAAGAASPAAPAAEETPPAAPPVLLLGLAPNRDAIAADDLQPVALWYRTADDSAELRRPQDVVAHTLGCSWLSAAVDQALACYFASRKSCFDCMFGQPRPHAAGAAHAQAQVLSQSQDPGARNSMPTLARALLHGRRPTRSDAGISG